MAIVTAHYCVARTDLGVLELAEVPVVVRLLLPALLPNDHVARLGPEGGVLQVLVGRLGQELRPLLFPLLKLDFYISTLFIMYHDFK